MGAGKGFEDLGNARLNKKKYIKEGSQKSARGVTGPAPREKKKKKKKSWREKNNALGNKIQGGLKSKI